MLTLHLADWLAILFIVGLMLALAFLSKVRDNTALQFLAAGRSLTVFPFVASLVSTWYGGVLGIGESVSFFGLGTWLLLGVPFYVFAIVYAIFLSDAVRKNVQITIPERFESVWGKEAALAAALLLLLLAIPAAHVLMLGVLLSTVTGHSLEIGVAVAAALGAACVVRGGLIADVRVAVPAFILMYVGFGFLLFWATRQLAPVEAIARLRPVTLQSWTGGAAFPAIISFFLLGAWTLVDPAFHQRVAAVRSPREAKVGLFVATLCWFVFDCLTIGCGIYALALLPELPEQRLAIFPALAEASLPPGLKGLFLGGVFGTILSALVGYTLVGGGTLGREIVGRLRTGASEESVTRWTRIGLWVVVVAAAVLALHIDSVVALWFGWSGSAVGALLVPLLIAYFSSKGAGLNGKWVAGASLVSGGVSLAWLVFAYRTNNPLLEVVWVRTASGSYPALPPLTVSELANAIETTTVSIGTLLPGLVICSILLAAGRVFSRGNTGI